MSDKQEAVQAVKWLKLATNKMSDLDISPTPKNYILWYEYFSARIPELNQAVDFFLSNNTPFTSSVNDDLYEHFFAEGALEKLRDMRDAVRALIGEISDQLCDLDSDVGGYEQSLLSNEEALEGDPDINTLKEVISRLLQDTRSVREANRTTIEKVKQLNEELECLRGVKDKLSAEVLIDDLTAVANRRAFDLELEKISEQSRTSDGGFCLLFLDIDHFKAFNDTHGHLVGDKVLRFVASIMKKAIRGGDHLSRYGGEEFAIILPNTDYDGGLAVATSVAEVVARQKLTSGREEKSLGKVTVSVGMSIYQAGDDPVTMVGRADVCLYQAKSEGRNKVVGEQQIPSFTHS